MKVILKKYKTPKDFRKDISETEIGFLRMKEAIDYARGEVAKVRGTLGWVGFKILDKEGKVKHKLF